MEGKSSKERKQIRKNKRKRSDRNKKKSKMENYNQGMGIWTTCGRNGIGRGEM